ncbi:DUF317 domain-containing protein [Streptomyces sp. NPDC017940]|uniref:DUF317 domain-containing protein n=1 Tax=Streptomyces sp. NPDC017940 TaxID=3365017 RepID=UPI00378C323E
MLQELLDHLADGHGWDTALSAPLDEKTIAAATQPLSDAGWKHTVDGRWIRWTSPAADAGFQFDAFAAQHSNQTLATWTVWAGPNPDHPTWALTASPHTPSSLLADLAENLAHATGTRRRQTTSREHRTSLDTAPSVIPAVPASPAAGRTH